MKVLFMGRKRISADTLEVLSRDPRVTVVGVLTDSHLDGSPTAAVARAKGYKLLTFEEALAALKDRTLTFDLGLSVLYWRKLRDEFLTEPRLGVINFHPAPLPDYKGTAGYNLAILDRLDTWAVTAHYVDADIDTGRIIEKQEFPIDSAGELCVTLERKSMIAMRSLIDRVLASAISSDQLLDSYENVGGRYVTRQQMEEMKKIQPGDDVSRKVRAFWFPPYDGAYIEIDGEKYTLVSRRVLNELAPPGTTSLFSSDA